MYYFNVYTHTPTRARAHTHTYTYKHKLTDQYEISIVSSFTPEVASLIFKDTL